MSDVVIDTAAVDAVVDLAVPRSPFDAEADRLLSLQATVAAGSPEFGVAATSVPRFQELLGEMARLESRAAVVVHSARLADGSAPTETTAAPAGASTLIAALLRVAPTGTTWAYDPAIAVVAAEEALTYEQAYFAVRTAQIDAVEARIETWPGTGNEAAFDRLVTERDALVADLAGDDPALAAAMIGLLNRNGPGYSSAEAAVAAPGVVWADASIGDLLVAIESRHRAAAEETTTAFDPFLVGLVSTLAVRLESSTGANAATVDPAIAAVAERLDLTYNEVVAQLRRDPAGPSADPDSAADPTADPDPAAGPAAVAGLETGLAAGAFGVPGRAGVAAPAARPAYLDVAVSTEAEAVALLGDLHVFRQIETAEPGGVTSAYDGLLAEANLRAVVDDPDRFDPTAVNVARFLLANPAVVDRLDAARNGTALRNLGVGRYHTGRTDGRVSYADVDQYATNRWVFDTLVADLDALDADGDGVVDEDEFQRRLDGLRLAPEVRAALDYALTADLADGGDDRPRWRRAGSSLWRISSLVPSSPSGAWRLHHDAPAYAHDQLAALEGAVGAVGA
ncbi:MAG: hypothetical protein ACFCVK_23855, partial [Acidimicrobiales bacterium]